MKKIIIGIISTLIIAAVGVAAFMVLNKNKSSRTTTKNDLTTSENTKTTEIVKKEYNVSFVDYDNTMLYRTKVKEGEMPVYSGTNPTRPDFEAYTYEFTGWSPELKVVEKDTIYTAQYTRRYLPYSLSFDLNGGKCSADDYQPTKRTDTLNKDDFNFEISKKGYLFKGWSYNNVIVFDNEGNLVNEVDMLSNMTFKAEFEEFYHHVSFVNYDNTELDSQDILDGFVPTYPYADPTRPNDDDYSYEFIGWNPEIGEVTKDTTYVAQYKATDLPYVISFDLDGGSSTDTIKTIKTDNITASLFSFNVSKQGHSFKGWSYNGVIIFDENGNKVNDITPASQMTFKAEYKFGATLAISYTLYNPKTNELIESYEELPTSFGNVSKTGVYSYNTNVNLFANLSEGYIFEGWYSQGILLSNSANYNFQMGDSDVEIEARIEYNSYNFTVYSNNTDWGLITIKRGETINYKESDSDVLFYTEQVTVTAFSKGNVRFLGWYYNNEKKSSNVIYTFNMVSSAYTLEAKWDCFNVTYVLNGGTNNVDNPSTYSVDMADIILHNPTKAGYTFVGWEYNGNTIDRITTQNACHMTIEAIWTYYTLTTSINIQEAGTISIYTNTKITVGDDVTITATVNSGYTFLGWFDVNNEKIEDQSFTLVMPDFNVVLEARYSVNSYNVSVSKNIANAGTISGNGTYDYKEEVTLTATTNEGYTFDGWYKNNVRVETSSTYSFAMPYNDLAIEARWTVNSYSLTLTKNISEAGTVTGANIYEYGESVTINAIANEGYVFDAWYINNVKTDYTKEATFTMPYNNLTIEAKFKYDSYNVSVTKNINDAGTVTGNGAYDYKEEVTLTATTNTGYTFDGWYENNVRVKINSTYSFTMPNKNVVVEARWTVNSYSLTLTKNISEAGTVTGANIYEYGESVTINAIANEGYVFDAWYINNVKTDYTKEATFTMPYNNLTIEAKFKYDSYNVSVTKNINDAGTITGNGEYDYKSNVTITATTNTGYTFLGWYDGETEISTNPSCSFTMPYNDISYEARYSINSYNVTLIKNISEAGTITESALHQYKSNVTIVATVNSGYTFLGWFDENDEKIENLSYTFTMPHDDVVFEARYSINSYSVTLTKNINDAGTVTGNGEYDYKSNVTITATTNTGYTFLGWYDGEAEISTNPAYSFNMPYEDVSYIAKYKVNSYDLILTNSDSALGEISESGNYDYDSDVTIYATPIYGYEFVGWFDGENLVSSKTTFSFKMPATDLAYEARWKIGSYIITLNNNIDGASQLTGSGLYEFGESVTITATDNSSLEFVGWHNGVELVSNQISYTFDMVGEDVTYTAIWIYTVTTSMNLANAGTITHSGKKGFEVGSNVTLTATLYLGYNWLGWYSGDDLVTENSEYTFEMGTESISFVAKYEVKEEMSIFYFSSDYTTCSINGIKDYTIEELVIPDYVTVLSNASINSRSFSKCSDLNKVTIGEGVTTIGSTVFKDCSNLDCVILGSNVKSIGNQAFYGCTNLIEVYNLSSLQITKGSTSYGYVAYYALAVYTSLDESGLVNWNGFIFIYDEKGYLLDYRGTDTEIVLPDYFMFNDEMITEYEIYTDAFKDKTTLTSIIVSNSVTQIAPGAFYGCSSLVTLSLPFVGKNRTDHSTSTAYADHIEDVFGYIFGYEETISSTLTGATMQYSYKESILFTYYFHFYIPQSLRNVIITDMESIPMNAFYNCSMISNISFGSSVKSIKTDAFYGCLNLLNAYYFGTIGDWCRIGFESNTSHPMNYANKFYIYKELTDDEIKNQITRIALESISATMDDVLFVTWDYYSNKENWEFHVMTNNDSNYYSFSSEDDVMMNELNEWLNMEIYNISGSESAYEYITEIVIPNGISSIGNYQFMRFSQLSDVEIPNTVEGIGDYAFSECTHLGVVIIPNGVITIGTQSFALCSNMASITIPNSVTSITAGAFTGCSSLQSITIPFVGNRRHNSTDTYQYPLGYIFGTTSYSNGIAVSQTYYGNKTTATTTTTYYIPALLHEVNITGSSYIPYGAFSNCDRIERISFDENVELIGKDAFIGCQLTGVYYYGNIENWCQIAFENYTSNPMYYATNFYLYKELTDDEIKDQILSIVLQHQGFTIEDINSVEWNYYDKDNWNLRMTHKNYGDFYFSSSDGGIMGELNVWIYHRMNDLSLMFERITEIVIPNGVESIGYSQFLGFSQLTSVEIPDTVTAIKNAAFYGCSNLEEIIIPNSVTTIGTQAFAFCSKITSIIIPDSVQSIGSNAFQGCSSLESITIPFTGDKVHSKIDSQQYPFGYIFGTTSYEGSSAIQQRYRQITSLTSSETYYIPTSLREVVLSGVSYIPYGSFYNCTFDIIICNNTKTTILSSDSLLYYKGNNIVLPSSITIIESSAFNSCSNLTNLYYNGTIENWFNISFGNASANPMSKVTNFYILDEDGTVEYKGNKYSNISEIIIPDVVQTIGSYQITGLTDLTNLTIPSSVKTIGTDAFGGCSNLNNIYYDGTLEDWCKISFASAKSNPLYYASNLYILDEYGEVTHNGKNYSLVTDIVIPNAITSIGNYQFYNFVSLESVTMQSGITSIGSYAFYNCSSITTISLPNSVKSIGTYAFYNCADLESFEFGNGVQTIGNYAFKNCVSLNNVVIGNAVQSIGTSAFEQCTNIISVIIGVSVTTIGNYAFKDCASLSTIVISNSVNSIGSNAFNNCTNLLNVYYNGTIENWCNISFVGDYSTPLCYGGEVYFIDNAGEIEYNGNHYSLVNNIVVPNTITKIGNCQFVCFRHVTSVTIPSNITEIGNYAFTGCFNLESITIPSSVTSIGTKAFANCRSLVSAEILAETNSLPEGLFTGCSSLEYLAIPFVGDAYHTKDDELNHYTFGYIFGTEAYGEEEATSQNNIAYYIPSSLREVVITGSSFIPDYAFDNCKYIEIITIPSTITEVGLNAFSLVIQQAPSAIPALTDVYYDGTLEEWCGISFESIESNPMYYAANFYILDVNGEELHNGKKYSTITNLVIPNTVSSIGDYQFVGFRSLEKITIPNTVTSIGTCSFHNCQNVENVVFEGNIDSIGEGCFAYCHSLTTVDLPSGIAIINEASFYWCENLNSIVIPDSVVEVAEGVFHECDSLGKIMYKGTSNQWSEITINALYNGSLAGATVYYYLESTPEEPGNYWHYVDDVPTIWGNE